MSRRGRRVRERRWWGSVCPRCGGVIAYRWWWGDPTKMDVTLVCRGCGATLTPRVIDWVLIVVYGLVAYAVGFAWFVSEPVGGTGAGFQDGAYFLGSAVLIGVVTTIGALSAPLWMRLRLAGGPDAGRAKCWSCRYDMAGNPSAEACPECGAALGYAKAD